MCPEPLCPLTVVRITKPDDKTLLKILTDNGFPGTIETQKVRSLPPLHCLELTGRTPANARACNLVITRERARL